MAVMGLFVSLSISSPPFIWSQAVFVLLPASLAFQSLFCCYHYSNGFIQHGSYLHRCRGRLVVPVIAVSCNGGRSTHPAWLCNDPPAFSPSNNSDCVQRQSKEFTLFVIPMPAHGRPSVRCFDVWEQSAFAIKGDPVLPVHCTGLPALLESLKQVQYVFL